MKALVLSDIHSNICALEAIWAHEHDSDAIYCAGDLVDYGPFPCEVLEWIREHPVVCVQGNHDARVAAAYRESEPSRGLPAEVREWRHHNAALLREDDIAWLEQLPLSVDFVLDGVRYGMSHLYAGYEVITSVHAFRMFCARTFSVDDQRPVMRLIFGHTHRQGLHYLRDDLLWLNPGSVSYRRQDDPDQAAHYATITDGVIALKQVSYDLAPLYRQVEQLALQDAELEVARWYFGPRAEK